MRKSDVHPENFNHVYNGIPIMCAECEAKEPENVHYHIMQRSKYTTRVRIFCGNCGAWYDWETWPETDEIKITVVPHIPPVTLK